MEIYVDDCFSRKGENDDMTMEEAAKAIGGAITRAHHLTVNKTNKLLIETEKFENIAMAVADGFEKKYADLLDLSEKFIYTVEVLTENNFYSALNGLKTGTQWLREHKEEFVEKGFMGYYMYGYLLDIYKSEIKIAREKAGLTQQQFSDLFNIPIDTVKSWDIGRRRPDELKEKLIIEKLEQIGRNSK